MEIDYQNSSTSSPEINNLGDELNQSVLKESDSTAGARDFSYSKKSSSSSNTDASQNVQKIAEQQTTAEITGTSVGTTVGTTAAVGGVVIATVVVFTSILGNQFKLVNDSLALSLYRDYETHEVNLDYSFDLQYDKSGSVYVKMISATDNLSSEEYKIVYEGKEEETIEYEEGEEVPTEEKTKDVYSVTIEGSFHSLKEKVDYTFAITSVIDGVESSIYTQNIYIPSSYVDVVEGGAYYYKDEEQGNITLSYVYQLKYESNSEAYVELRHVSPMGENSLIETSEIYYLDISNIDNRIEGTNRYMMMIDGVFSSKIINHDEYIVSLLTTSEGQTNISYSERIVVEVEEEPPVEQHQYSFIKQPNVQFTSYYGTIFLQYEAEVASEYDGEVIVNIIDTKEEYLYTRSYAINVYEESTSLVLADSYADDLQLGQSYKVEFVSRINDYQTVIYEQSFIADGEFGYIDENTTSFSVSSAYDQGADIYYIEYNLTLMSKMNGHDLKIVVKDKNNAVIKTEMVAESFDYQSGASSEYMPLSFEGNIETDVSGPYTLEIYVTYGSEQLLYTTTAEEPIINPYSFSHEPSVSFSTQSSILTMYYSAVVIGENEGSVRVEVMDVTNKTNIYNQLFTITPSSTSSGAGAGDDGTSVYGNVNVNPDLDYQLTITSIINGKEVEIWNKIYTSNGDFAEILNDTSFSARYYSDAQSNVIHELNYDIYLKASLNGTNLTMKVYDTSDTLIMEELLDEVFAPLEEEAINKQGSIVLNQEGPYVVKIYATFGVEHLLYTSEQIEETSPTAYTFDVTPEVSLFTDQMGNLLLKFSTSITPTEYGSLGVTITDVSSGDTPIYSQTFEMNEIGEQIDIEDVASVEIGHQYRVKMTSIINGNYVEIYNELTTADGEFASISEDSNFFAVYYTSNLTQETVHQIDYDVACNVQATGSNLVLKVYNSDNELLKEVLLREEFGYSQDALEFHDSLTADEAGPYTIKIFATFATEHLLYSTQVDEIPAPSYEVSEDNCETRVYNDGGIYAEVSINFMAVYAGQIYFELVNNTTHEVVSTSESYQVEINESEMTNLESNFLLEDISTSYTIRIHSVINDIDVMIREAFVNTNQEYGYASDLNVQGYNNNATMTHEVTGTFYSEFACMITASFTDETTGDVFYSNPVEIPANEDYQFSTVLEGQLTGGSTYDVRILANWGQGDVELENTNFMYQAVSYYGLEADLDNAIKNYEDNTLTILATVIDDLSYLADITAVIEFADMGSSTSGNRFVASYDNSVGGFVFHLNGVEMDSLGQITITAIDSHNNNVTITFIDTTIIY